MIMLNGLGLYAQITRYGMTVTLKKCNLTLTLIEHWLFLGHHMTYSSVHEMM